MRGGNPDLDDAFPLVHDLPRAQWDVIADRLCEHAAAEHPTHEQWCAAQRLWLERVAAALGGRLTVAESERFLLMAPSPDSPHWVLDLCEQAQDRVEAAVGPRPGEPRGGKLVVLVFPSEHAYRQHLRYFRRDENPGESAGACVNDRGEAHVALPGLGMVRMVLPHELVHAHLAALPLPLWLNEGIAQLVARRRLDPGMEFDWPQHARLYWRTRGLARFWSGEGFHGIRATEEVVFAYLFAELLVKEIRGLSEPDFRRFLETADVGDAGDAACRTVYGFGLQAWCQRLLGAGDWTPRPEPGGWAQTEPLLVAAR